ncbi:hypothetical protein [Helicobacter typhlonius]
MKILRVGSGSMVFLAAGVLFKNTEYTTKHTTQRDLRSAKIQYCAR